VLCDYQEKSESDNQHTSSWQNNAQSMLFVLRFKRAAMPSASQTWIWLLGCCWQGGLNAHSGIEFCDVVQ
jgi:hypothetical protein